MANIINCCSLGEIKYINGNVNYKSQSGIIAGNSGTSENCYYLNKVPGTTGLLPREHETMFYKSADAEALGLTKEDDGILLTEDVVSQLNFYIQSNGTDTAGWCRWIMGDNETPILDFNTEWNGTAWVTVTD